MRMVIERRGQMEMERRILGTSIHAVAKLLDRDLIFADPAGHDGGPVLGPEEVGAVKKGSEVMLQRVSGVEGLVGDPARYSSIQRGSR